MKYVLVLLAALAFAGLNNQAFAATTTNADQGEGFADPTFRDLSMMLVMMDGVNISDPKVADDYAKMNFCSLYKEKYKNDFEWNKIRQEVITRVQSKKDYYRLQYELDGTVNLDRYNFDTQDFPLTKKTVMDRVGSMILYDGTTAPDNPNGKVRFLCNDPETSKVFPGEYMFILSQPLTFDRLKMPMDEAKALLERMQAEKNTDRRLYVRFRLRVTGIQKVNSNRVAIYEVDVKGDVMSVDVFLDHDMTKYLTSINMTKF